MIKKKNRFIRGVGTYKCWICGKLTRETGDDESDLTLCKKCYWETTLENDHFDNGHEEYMEGCPECGPKKE